MFFVFLCKTIIKINRFFCGFSKKWQSFFEQKQVVCVLPFLCGFLEDFYFF